MLFNSLNFLLFFPVVVLLYYTLPKKMKNGWLLIASYFFYMCWNVKYIVLILFSTVITYISGLLLEQVKQKTDIVKKERLKKWIVGGSFCLNLAVLVYFKYTNFLIETLCKVFGMIGITVEVPVFDILLPVGISFYTFQALSYTMDVYREEIYAEKNFFEYALFVSFFPQLVAGPIERSKKLLKQLANKQNLTFERFREGILLMLWGYFLKLVIADRAAVFVNTVYGNYVEYSGWFIAMASVLFAVQIYCDFYGYSTIAMGAAMILGIQLTENFEAPYLSTTVAEFWRKWHISLTSWFKDYLYIPLGGSKKGNLKKYRNIMIVFLCSGLWHGASLSFVVWGGLNGLYQIVGNLLMPIRDRVVKILQLNRESLGHKLLGIVGTFLFVDFSWIFFRANGLLEAIDVIKHMFIEKNTWILFDGSLYACGLDSKEFTLLLVAICILVMADICKYNGIKIRNVVLIQDYWVRWLFISVSVCVILVFGVWGIGYDAASFIYFQF